MVLLLPYYTGYSNKNKRLLYKSMLTIQKKLEQNAPASSKNRKNYSVAASS